MKPIEAISDPKGNKEEILAVQEKIDVLNGELKRKKLEFSVIQILSNEIITSLDLDRIFQVAMQSLDEYFGFSHSLILLNDSDNNMLTVSASHGYFGEGLGARVAIGQGVIGVVAKRRKMMRSSGMGYRKIYVQSVQKNMNLEEVIVPLPGLQNVGSQLAIPLVVKDDLIGVYAIESSELNAFDSIDEQILMIVGNQIGSAISNAQAYRQIEELKVGLEIKVFERTKKLEKQKKEIQELNLLIKSLNENLDLEFIMEKVHKYLKDKYRIQYFSLFGFSKNKNYLSLLVTKLPDHLSAYILTKIRNIQIPIHLNKGGSFQVLKQRKPLYVKNGMHPRWQNYLTKEELFVIVNSEIKSYLSIPLIVNSEPIGVLNFSNSEEDFNVSKYDIDQISILCENLAGIIYSSKLFSEIEEEKNRTESEKEKTDKLLLNILPPTVANELKETNMVKPQYIQSASVLFTDFVGFTQISENLSPAELIQELDGCFSQFDGICKHNNLEKLKTIGDAYMCAGGLPVINKTHPIDICLAALEFRSFMLQMGEIKKTLGLPFWELRIGIHTGSVTAGVIGTEKFSYDIWGDTVNTASRMESSGEPGKINISETTYELVNHLFQCESRGRIVAKGKGAVEMYFLERIRPVFSADPIGLVPNDKFFLQLERYK
ncbi:adenylate/guanylate cyclase domain-containing protein [Leptospira sp. 96542]|nr:adenylate/guanylate cyclase domain-containing protein [Leptospira sp. 96542]